MTLNEIEERIDTSRFVYDNENIWPIFRNAVGWEIALRNNAVNNVSLNKVSHKKISLLKLFLKSILLLIISLFKKYDYIIFSTSDDYRNIDGKFKNRLTDELIEKYENSNILEIQASFDIIKSSKNRNYLPQFIFLIFVDIFSKFVRISKIDSIEDELKKINIKIDSKKIIKKYISSQKIHKFLFNLYRPKKIFTTCYSFMPIVKLANDLNIDTLEFQHGVIENHFAYDVRTDINSIFYPKKIAVFGINTLKYLEQRYYSTNIFPVGNMLVHHYSKKMNEYIINLKKEYKLVICVSLQWTIIKDMVNYVEKQAEIYKDICFILIPRSKNELSDYISIFDNIKILENINCYEIAANSDYHMTCYSTCALEAPSLGVENIFLNINGLSEKYFFSFINEKLFNSKIELEDEISIFLTKIRLKKEKVMEENKENIMNNYEQNIKYLYKQLEVRK
ncbi:hypothetical protein RJ999_02045 [Aliarcobacter butzleri]|uniref:hypothetical protein n=1 Tax=Aliarcobacter butzleri TaxID=28197 RepID=UPI002875D3F4|nr:hypothetical protein [Aliarcobacter butzleri]MDS1369871.1 hypothetical protein [Aliarcobacter butzleri]